MEDWIYANTYEKNQLLIKKMKENVEYAVRRLESHLEHDYPMNYVDQLAIQAIREYNNSKLNQQEQEKESKELRENVKRWHDTLKSKNEYASETVVAEIEDYWAIKAGV